MKKIIIIAIVLIFSNILFSNPKITIATTPTFQTEEEIDAYYDAQKLQNREDYENKVQDILNQSQINIDNYHQYIEEKKWESYRESYGENFELFKPFFPESKTDPAVLAEEFLGYSRDSALNAIEIVKIINPDLANKVIPIYNKKYQEYQELASNLEKLNDKYFGENSYNQSCVSKYGSGSAWDGVENEDGTFYCTCLSGYKIGENKKCIPVSIKTNTEKSTTVVDSEELTKDELIKTEIVNPEPQKKIKWYKRIFNWLFN